MIVDALGNPLALSLTGGQTHDITQSQTLPKSSLARSSATSATTLTPQELNQSGLPPKFQRECDVALYAERNLGERGTRYEKTARSFLAGPHFIFALARFN